MYLPLYYVGYSRYVLPATYKPTVLYNFKVSDMQMLHRTVFLKFGVMEAHSVMKEEDVASTATERQILYCVRYQCSSHNAHKI